ncbi:hypothetical protein FRC14_005297 [Serendipita sp. 396]|nr:hypothetical protein FRC14_005297 [Serendipita sp. 396]
MGDKGSPTAPTEAVDENTIWSLYEKQAIPRDKETLDGCSQNLNGLLVYAGLFSAVLTAFIIESMKLLQEDPYELALGALSAISHQLNNTNNPVYTRPIFIVPKNAVTINGFFFASLICSLLSALAALLTLQWIEAYKDKLTTSNLKQRVLQRHLRYTGFLKWNVPELVAVLPLILLASVFLFLTGLTVWMWGTNRTIGKIVLAGEVIGSLYYLNAVYAAALFYDAPFKSPFSSIIFDSMRRVKLILDLIPSRLHLVDISPLVLTALWGDLRLEEFRALFPLSTNDLEKLHLSSEALKTRTIGWIISQLSSERIFLFQLLQYLQAILNSGGSKGRNEGTMANKFQDISLEVKVIADVLYPNAIEREYDDLDADTLSVLAQCATSELFNNFNYNQLADRKREGVSGLFGDLSMIKDPTGDELKVIVGLAYWRHSPLSKDYLEFWIDLREGKSRRGRQHSSRILEYAMHRIRHLLLTDEPGSSFLVEQIAGKVWPPKIFCR